MDSNKYEVLLYVYKNSVLGGEIISKLIFINKHLGGTGTFVMGHKIGVQTLNGAEKENIKLFVSLATR